MPQALRENWERVRRLGEGGQATVIELRHRTSGIACALKQPRRDSPYALRRFERELDALKALRHPNVVALLDSAPDKTWFTMPVGRPLTEYWPEVRQSGVPEEIYENSLGLMRDILNGLAAAHKSGFVHRDVKPSNVLVIDGVAKVADFGIVHVPEVERLTAEPAANTFAPHVPSLYNPTVAPKLGDCFGAVCLWAWMLAANPGAAYGRYHWRWHEFIVDDRCEIVRTALAVCGDEQHAPVDAQDLLAFLEREIGLRLTTMPPFDSKTVAQIAQNQSVAKARAMQDSIAQEALVANIALSIQATVDAIALHCEQLAQNLSAHGVEIYVRYSQTLPEPRPLREIVEESASSPGSGLAIVTISTRRDDWDTSMQACLGVHWHKYPHENGRKISLGLFLAHSIPELRRDYYYNVVRGGALLDNDSGESVSAADITAEIDRFMLDPSHHV